MDTTALTNEMVEATIDAWVNGTLSSEVAVVFLQELQRDND